ncbi:MAG TPA: cytochrome b/b6 domain-containing protein [Devosiaceae bacterium]|nr:cytochrome b/b6 domain-containing protein [Devosiaceae bacterium]
MATITESGTSPAETPVKAKGPLIYRQSIFTRLTHWLWVICLFFLLFTGLNIFNADPALYFSKQSGVPDMQAVGQPLDNAWLNIGGVNTDNGARGQTTIFGKTFDTTGVLGVSGDPDNPDFRGFPAQVTIPSYYDLATARVVHFFFGWILVATLAVWLIASIFNRHIAAVPPSPRDLRHLPKDILNHLRFRFEHGRKYNTLQKIAYSVVLFILFPLIIATGLTMSPGMNAGFPWLLDLFGGRQTARSIHFLTMSALVLFFVVHIVMVVLAGPINEMRQMITGRYRASPDVPFDAAKKDKK